MASMSQLADDFFTCTLCVEKFRDPRTLPCLHSFCRLCLGAHVRQTLTKGVFLCPQCRQETRPEVAGLTVDQWMETLAANHFITGLLRIAETRHSEKACDICRQEHVLVEAVGWCKECLEALCEDCERVHGRSRASRDHHVVNMEYLENEALEKLIRPKRGPLVCPEHNGNPVSVACVKCKQFVCETCMSVSHGGCKKTRRAEVKVVADLKRDIVVVIDGVKVSKQAITTGSRTCEEHLEMLTKSRDAALEDISVHVKKLMNLILEKQNKMVSDVETIYDKQREQFAESVVYGDVRINSLTKTEMFLDHLLVYGSDMDILNNFENIMKQSETLNKQMPVTNQVNVSVRLKYIADKKAVDKLRSLANLGELKVVKACKTSKKKDAEAAPKLLSPRQIPSSSGSSPYTGNGLLSPRDTPRRKPMTSFTGRSPRDMMRTDIRGILLLRSGDVVVMDVHFRNMKLKKFTPRGKLVSEADVGECPHAIALVSKHEAVISLPKTKEFAFVTVGGTLHVTGKIKTAKSYFSLASSSDEVLATIGLSPPDPPCVDVVSCNGEVLHSIPLDRIKFPRPPLDLTLPPTGDILLLCPSRDLLVCINMSGEILYTCQAARLQEIKSPVAITTDTHGRALLVDKAASKIHVISGDGRHQGELLCRRDGLVEPLAATVGDSGIVAVAQSNGDIKLFTFN